MSWPLVDMRDKAVAIERAVMHILTSDNVSNTSEPEQALAEKAACLATGLRRVMDRWIKEHKNGEVR